MYNTCEGVLALVPDCMYFGGFVSRYGCHGVVFGMVSSRARAAVSGGADNWRACEVWYVGISSVV